MGEIIKSSLHPWQSVKGATATSFVVPIPQLVDVLGKYFVARPCNLQCSNGSR